MKVFQCDGCGAVIKDPFEQKMKEFYVEADFEFGYMLPHARKNKVTVHLCKECYAGLHLVGRTYYDSKEKIKRDTAKDILQNLYKCHPLCLFNEVFERLAKKYGINLEE